MSTWTPARGAAALVNELGDDVTHSCLSSLLCSEVGPDEFERYPWSLVLAHIGRYREPSGPITIVRDGTPLDLSRPGNAYWARSWAARAMAYVGDERSRPALLVGLRDDHWRVRMTAAQSIGRLRLHGVASALSPLLDDPHPRVVAAAELAIERTL